MLWWLSFANDAGFLGVVIAEGASLELAVRETHARGCNPGGQVAGFSFAIDDPDVQQDRQFVAWFAKAPRWKVLSKEQLPTNARKLPDDHRPN